MKIYYDSSLITGLGNSFLFLDTTAFIAALNYKKEFGELFKSLKDQGCSFLTIPSVFFEFTRGSDTLISFKTRAKFLTGLADIWPIERYLDQIEQAMVVLQKLGSRQMSYTDFLLCVCLYKFPSAYLLTENYHHIPVQVFERKGVITVDAGEDIRNHVVFQLSRQKFSNAAEGILRRRGLANVR